MKKKNKILIVILLLLFGGKSSLRSVGAEDFKNSTAPDTVYSDKDNFSSSDDISLTSESIIDNQIPQSSRIVNNETSDDSVESQINPLNDENQVVENEVLDKHLESQTNLLNNENQVVENEVLDKHSGSQTNLLNDENQIVKNRAIVPSSSETKLVTPFWSAQWDIQMETDFGNSFKYIQNQSSEVKIGVIDSGINIDNFPFRKNSFSLLKNYVSSGGYSGCDSDESGESSYVVDKTGHGTAVVSQIIGDSNLQGIYPYAKINIYRIFGDGPAKTEWILRAIKDAVDDGNDIINLSLGKYLMISGSYEDGTNDLNEFNLFKKVLDYAYERDVVVIAAAGNESLNLDDNDSLINFISTKKKIEHPGKVVDVFTAIPSVISVGGIDIFGSRSDFSNFSNKLIYAPAGTTKNFKSMPYSDFLAEGYYLTDWILAAGNRGYQYLSGNSLAAAKVTGIVAAAIGKYDFYKQVDLVNAHILQSLVNIDGLNVLFMTPVVYKDSVKEQKGNGLFAQVREVVSEQLITTKNIEDKRNNQLYNISNKIEKYNYNENKLPDTGDDIGGYELLGVFLVYMSVVFLYKREKMVHFLYKW
ncbi:S8 family serine peptidase [Streptococcus thermophilus]|uniref:S8 family serine peptidase n=1 Tax=Streptococcus thermophilus TaxID=1308 RepID=UPI00321C300D